MDWIETGVSGVDLRRVALTRRDGSTMDLMVVRGSKALSSTMVQALVKIGCVPFGSQSHAKLYSSSALSEIAAVFPAVRRVSIPFEKANTSLIEAEGMFPDGEPIPFAVARGMPSPPLRRARPPLPSALPRTSTSAAPSEPVADASIEVATTPPSPTSQPDEPKGEKGLQTPYFSPSGVATSMIPRALAGPTARALERLESEVGPIADWVATRLRWTPTEMAGYLAPEQVDAVALYLFATMEDRAFVLADMTGLGKGRVVAAIIRCAILEGRPVVFFTEKPNLFSDIYRDIADIGSLELVGRPFVLNTGVSIVDTTTKDVVFPALEQEAVDKAIKAKRFPEGFKLLLAGYPQISDGPASPKAAFLRAAVAQAGADVYLDECHNAAGDSNTSEAMETIVAEAHDVLWSSATFAKVAQNLAVYRRLFPPSMRSSDLEEILSTGGRPLAEALIQMLAESGSYLRREHDLSKIPVRLIVDEQRIDRNKAMGDALSPILRNVAALAREVFDLVKGLNEKAEAEKRKETWSSGSFGSRLSVISRQFTTSLLVDFCVERGLQHVAEGKKPVPIVESTMESLMRELFSGEEGAEETAALTEGERAPTFRDVLNVLVDRTLMMSVRRPKMKDPERVKIEVPDLVEQGEAIKRMIARFPDLPLSPLDEIRERFAAQGHAFGEVSARGMRIEQGRVVPAPKLDRMEEVANFNNGTYVGMTMTRAGSTGLSAHASEKFKDQRPRVMQELQIAQNVGERVQFHGRTNRRGQTSTPEIETYSTGLPFQARNLAMQNRKLAALSANTTGTSANMGAMDVVDVLDAIGNEVAKDMLEANPALARKLHIAMKLTDMEEAEANLYHVDKIGQRLIMLPSDEQERVFDELIRGYRARLADMAARGESLHGERDLPGNWVIADREVLEPGNEEDGPIFGAPVYVTTIETETRVDPWTSARVEAAVAKAWAKAEAVPGDPVDEELVRALEATKKKALQAALTGHFLSVDQALRSSKPNSVKDTDERFDKLVHLVRSVRPGHVVHVTNDDGTSFGAVIDLVRPAGQDELHRPGSWTMRYIMPGDERPRSMSLAGFMAGGVAIHSGDAGRVPRSLLTRFDAAPKGSITVSRKVIDGNPVKAVMVARREGWSSLVSWADGSGTENKGVLVPKAKQTLLATLPGRVSDPEAAYDVAVRGAEIWTHPDGSERGASLMLRGKRVQFSVPSGKRARKPFQTEAIERLCGNFSDEARPTASVPAERLGDLLAALAEAGHAFHYPGQFRSAVESKTGFDEVGKAASTRQFPAAPGARHAG